MENFSILKFAREKLCFQSINYALIAGVLSSYGAKCHSNFLKTALYNDRCIVMSENLKSFRLL